MEPLGIRTYARNSPQAAGRIVALALVANGEINACEWDALHEVRAHERLGLRGPQWHDLLDDLCSDLIAASRPGQDCIVDATTLEAWLDQVDDPKLRTLVIELAAAIIQADGHVHPGESVVLRAALACWELSMDDRCRIEPLIYGLDFQVVPRRDAASQG
jgi:uncharacterized tellurite resistance protein B-like protein